MTVWQGILLGLIQGIAEWLPISSEAMVNLAAINVFNVPPVVALNLALLLHLGTILAAAAYFRDTLLELLRHPKANKNQLQFYLVTTVISLGLGGVIYLGLEKVAISAVGGSVLTIIMGISLLVTAWLLSRKFSGGRNESQLTVIDGVILGVTQGLALIPGISRSGSTGSVLLWRSITPTSALRVSFIMGIPMIGIGAMVLLFQDSDSLSILFSLSGLLALLTTFIVGLATINILMKVATKLDFTKFVLGMGLVSIAAGIISLL